MAKETPSRAPLILEVRANEYALRENNPNVPYGAEALVADALLCEKAGATVYHWHPRGEDGIERADDAELNGRVIKRLRDQTSLVLHPTLGFTSTQGDVETRLKAIRKLQDAGQYPDFVPVDIGSVITDRYDAGIRKFASTDAVLLNRTGYVGDLLGAIEERGLAVMAVVWSPGAIRTALCLREQRGLQRPAIWQLGFTGPAVPGGLPASATQLEAFLEVIPAGEPWNVHVRDGDGMEMATEAILRGGHVAIGLGDDPFERFGYPTNAEVIARVADIARSIGRPLASAAETRTILGLDR